MDAYEFQEYDKHKASEKYIKNNTFLVVNCRFH